jgi:NADH-quinone oxidoreductase subunit E
LLTTEEQAEIKEELAHYPNKQAVSIDAMLIVQRHRGWVSDESIRDIAGLLEMSTADLDGVATFYNLIRRKAVGRHVVLICDSVSCWIMGCDRVRDQLCTRLGTTLGGSTADGRFTLLPVVCLGACDHAPAMMIDDDLHTNLEEQHMEHILEQYR